jgi:hypothetical protein
MGLQIRIAICLTVRSVNRDHARRLVVVVRDNENIEETRRGELTIAKSYIGKGRLNTRFVNLEHPSKRNEVWLRKNQRCS